jgi:hypothetical protein
MAEVDGVGNKGSGGTTAADLQTLLQAFLNMSLRAACFTDETYYLVKAILLVLGLFSSGARLSGFPNY